MMRFEKDWLLGVVVSAACVLSMPAIVRSQETAPSSPQSSSSQGTTPVANRPAEADPLLLKVEQALQLSKKRYLSAEIHTPWQIAHGILAYRNDFEIKKNGKLVNAIDWVSDNATYKGTPWFEKTSFGGRAQPFTQRYIFQGHPNQFLGYFTLSRLPLDHQFRTGTDAITIQNLVENAKMEVNANEEITWTLWALSHYLPPDAEWRNQNGENWSIERLVQIQTDESVYDGACGGTHGLFALSYARNKYLYSSGGQLRGVWLEADQKIRRFITEAKASQNSDGTFSPNYFNGRGHSDDFNTRLATTGHMLEWLMVAVRSDELRSPWIRHAVDAICNDLLNSKDRTADVAPLYHGIDALMVYHNRVKPKPDVTSNTRQTEEKPQPPLPESVTGTGGE
ncbi:MAG: hypothetical protein WEB58_04220 [Planctomycetaceae bacterium]